MVVKIEVTQIKERCWGLATTDKLSSILHFLETPEDTLQIKCKNQVCLSRPRVSESHFPESHFSESHLSDSHVSESQVSESHVWLFKRW